MNAINIKNKEKNDCLYIKDLYKQIRKGCQRKICYNIYCYNNLIGRESTPIVIINIIYFIF